MKSKYDARNIIKISLFFVFITVFFNNFKYVYGAYQNKTTTEKNNSLIFQKDSSKTSPELSAELNWERVNKNKNKIIWELISDDDEIIKKLNKDISNLKSKSNNSLNSHNRSIVFNNKIIGPEVSWLFPPGFKWNNKYKFDYSIRGHNTRIPEPPNKKFFGWNNGDAIGLASYQFFHKEKSSFGLNLGIRSVYQGEGAEGGHTAFGEGISTGFRWDYELNNSSGFALGAEQLIHFDSLTDSGRNIYLIISKGWWSNEYRGEGIFPLYVATAGVGTGRMAVGGKIKGLCSELLGSDGTDYGNFNRLCWSPVFSLASVWNEKFSTFFEFNNRFFILGNSFSPFKNVPIKGTLGLIISDHIDNYKIHKPTEFNWAFNLSIGF